MPALHLRDVALTTPDGRLLVPTFSYSFAPHRIGLIGRNGSGKSTLLRLVAGDMPLVSGTIHAEGRISLMRQDAPPPDATIADALGVAAGLDRLKRVQRGTGDADDVADADWTLPARIASALADMGLPDLAMSRSAQHLSGGQQTRLGIAALMLAQPDIVLLDEPTNNLDAEGREAIRRMLARWKGMAIIASHDRELLAHVDDIVELTTLGLTAYGGNWAHYLARRDIELAAAEHDLAVARRDLRETERKAQERRERKARSDARGARKAARGDMPAILVGGRKRAAENTAGMQSRLAEKRQQAAADTLRDASARIEILAPVSVTLASTGLPTDREVLRLEEVSWPAEGRPVLTRQSLRLAGPERVAICGPNGSGKTSLLRIATGQLAQGTGRVWITPRHAMLDQHVSLLNPAWSVRENFLRHNPDDDENACRAALARFRFRAEAALQPVEQLSGGERLRAGLAVTIGAAHPPELLILDEPTNHLDLDAVAALEAGLAAYDGALLVVSHDAAFLNAIEVSRRIEL